MNIKMKIVGALLALGLVFSSSAPASAAYLDWTTITSMQTFNDGHVVVTFAAFTGAVACPGGGSQFSLGLNNSPGQKNMVQLATSAFLAGRHVRVQTAPGVCNGGQEVVTSLQVFTN